MREHDTSKRENNMHIPIMRIVYTHTRWYSVDKLFSTGDLYSLAQRKFVVTFALIPCSILYLVRCIIIVYLKYGGLSVWYGSPMRHVTNYSGHIIIFTVSS